MKNINAYLFTFFAIFALSSCQDVVQLKLEEGAKKYAIDAFVNDLRTTQKIRVLRNNAYFSDEAPEGIANATVLLKDLSTSREFPFKYDGDGYYIYEISGSDTLAVVNHQYELNVTIDGHVYTALSIQKRPALIDTITAELIAPGSGGFGPPSTETRYMCTLSAYDLSGPETDYYWVKTFRNDSLLFGPADINVAIDGTNGPVMLEGVPYTAFTPPITFLGFKMFPPGSSCKVEIHSLTKEGYFFFVQARNQINNSGLFATTPENVRTNIVTPSGAPVHANGWFNVASVSSYKIYLP